MRRILIVLPVVLSLIAPAAAMAGKAEITLEEEGTDRGGDPVFSETLRYTAAPGEANRLTIEDGDEGAVLVTDSAGVTLGRGCTRPVPADTTRARCTPSESLEYVVSLGDGDDVGRSTVGYVGSMTGGAGADTLTAPILDGGPGDDVLTGSETIKGGPGNDDMTGVPNNIRSSGVVFNEGDADNGSDTIRGQNVDTFGGDSVRYAARTEGIRADLQGDRDDGAPGERDMIASNVESIYGGRGNDVISGDTKENGLVGGGGRDTLNGGAGDDALVAGRGRTRDVLNGGPGDDVLSGNAGANRLNPGPGADTLETSGGADIVGARDGFLDRFDCGSGRERLRLDRLDFITRDCGGVTRRGLAAAVPLGFAVFNTGDLPYAEIGCPADASRRCVGTVTTLYRGRVLSRKSFNIGRGRVGDINVIAGRRALEGKTVRLRVRSRVNRRVTRTVTAPALVTP